jgi:hypothetical protein
LRMLQTRFAVISNVCGITGLRNSCFVFLLRSLQLQSGGRTRSALDHSNLQRL